MGNEALLTLQTFARLVQWVCTPWAVASTVRPAATPPQGWAFSSVPLWPAWTVRLPLVISAFYPNGYCSHFATRCTSTVGAGGAKSYANVADPIPSIAGSKHLREQCSEGAMAHPG